jgi:hypothetical protein
LLKVKFCRKNRDPVNIMFDTVPLKKTYWIQKSL